ncbi:MAG: hypothetical protein PHD83_01660 [Caldisericia bacterium]|nr:hypothetical protein [Caldisericia bacterium]
MKKQIKSQTRKNKHWLLVVYVAITVFIVTLLYLFAISRPIEIGLYRKGGLYIETNELRSYVGNQEKYEEVYRNKMDQIKKCLNLRLEEIGIVNPSIRAIPYHRFQIIVKNIYLPPDEIEKNKTYNDVSLIENIIFAEGILSVTDASGEEILTNEHLANADYVLQKNADCVSKQPVVVLLLNEEGKKALSLKLVSNRGKKIQLFLDQHLLAEISSSDIFLTGKIIIPFIGENQEEAAFKAEQTAAILNGGSLPDVLMTKHRTVFLNPNKKRPYLYFDWLIQKNN